MTPLKLVLVGAGVPMALRVCLVLAFRTTALAFFALPQLFLYCDIHTSTDNKHTQWAMYWCLHQEWWRMRCTLVIGGGGWLLTVLFPLTTVALRVCLVLAFGTPALAFFAFPQLFFYCDTRTSTDIKHTLWAMYWCVDQELWRIGYTL
jgi:hypothetical protein